MSDRADDQILVSIARGASGALQVRRCSYRGKAYFDVREFYRGEDGSLLPGKKGCTLKSTAEIEAVVKALTGARL